MSSGCLNIWILSDGKPGHESQTFGLAQAIARLTPAEIWPLRLPQGGGLVSRFRAAAVASAELPPPDLVLGAGHATHLVLLWLARRHGAKSVVLMKPSLPLAWFDFCIAPTHDFPSGNKRPNVLLTQGALNRVTPGTGTRTGKLILIGGPSKTHGWDGPRLLDALAPITADGGWDLTDSRRTPEEFLPQLAEKLPAIRVLSHHQTPSDWVQEKLRHAGEVWVTEDSVSMIYEALTSGAMVGLLPLPRLAKKSRVLNGVDGLIANGSLTAFSAWTRTRMLRPPPQPFEEAARCAKLLTERIRPTPA